MKLISARSAYGWGIFSEDGKPMFLGFTHKRDADLGIEIANMARELAVEIVIERNRKSQSMRDRFCNQITLKS